MLYYRKKSSDESWKEGGRAARTRRGWLALLPISSPPSLSTMNSLTRQLGRIALTSSSSSSYLSPRPALLVGAAAARLAIPSTSTFSTRGYATESSHLGNLSPAPGSAHKVRLDLSLLTFLSRTAKLTAILTHLSSHCHRLQRKRIGRGIGSGRGGTSGRGHKGQGARSGNGKPALHFAGGQTPITRAYPKRGFKNPYVNPRFPSPAAPSSARADLSRLERRAASTSK